MLIFTNLFPYDFYGCLDTKAEAQENLNMGPISGKDSIPVEKVAADQSTSPPSPKQNLQGQKTNKVAP